MGVNIQIWRIRIGTFIQPGKSRNTLKCLYVSGKAVFSVFRVCLLVSVLLLMCGDVESNPGPARGGHQSIHGRVDEDWAVTEEKVRSFIKNEMEMPGHESVEIERAHRLKSSDRNKCTIIVKFTKFKDREAILRKASDIFDHESPFSVQADYTQRVKKHRRELGKEMIAARQNGQNAKIQYDKLVIDNKVYRYDDARESSVLVRDNNRQPRGYSARGSLYMGSADFRRHLGQPHGTANQNDSGSVNGDEARANDSARNESEALGGATGGDDGNLGEVY